MNADWVAYAFPGLRLFRAPAHLAGGRTTCIRTYGCMGPTRQGPPALGGGQPSISQPDLLQQCLETRLGTQRVKKGLNLEIDDQTAPLLVQAFQARDRFGAFANARIEPRQIPIRPFIRLPRRNVGLSRVDLLERLRPAT